MSGTSSLCAFCHLIPLDVGTLEKLRPKARSDFRSGGPPPMALDMDGDTQIIQEDRAVFELGNTERVLSSNCPFCSIVATAVRDIRRIKGWEGLKADTPLSLIWSHHGPGSKGVFTLNDNQDVYICFVAERSTGTSTEKAMQSSACVIHPTASRLEASSISRWIANCEDTHGAECNADTNITGPIKDSYRGLHLLRFVDVHRGCIVERTEAVRYVALSYVWGAAATLRLTKMNKPQMHKPGALSRLLLPGTIWDAIDLTRACGEQYLWVDSLCIMQNDVEDLDAGTRVMDLVYELSVFTIVAASGHDAAYGLPGLNHGLRVAPTYTEVSPGVRLGVISELDALINTSCYATRGWTMQEEMLSKRVLYFVDDKIFFHCPYETMFEGCSEPLYWQPAGGLLRMEKPLQDCRDLIRDYSIRVLKKEDDAFRALSGIMRRISDTQQWQIIAGMPTKALEHVMLFQSRQHILCRRRAFPSYSWLGWQGALDFMKGADLEGWIIWYVWNPASNRLSIDLPPVRGGVNTKTLERLGTSDFISQIKPEFGMLSGIDLGQQVPSDRGHVRPPRSFPLLCFWTLAVFFDLLSVDYVKGTAEFGSVRIPRYSGKIILDGLDDYPISSAGEFILLSRTGASEHGDMKYTGMLIEWLDGVAERRGIGYINPSEIEYSRAPGPIWKEITLG